LVLECNILTSSSSFCLLLLLPVLFDLLPSAKNTLIVSFCVVNYSCFRVLSDQVVFEVLRVLSFLWATQGFVWRFSRNGASFLTAVSACHIRLSITFLSGFDFCWGKCFSGLFNHLWVLGNHKHLRSWQLSFGFFTRADIFDLNPSLRTSQPLSTSI